MTYYSMQRNYRLGLLFFFSLIAIFAGCSDQKKKLLFISDAISTGDAVDPEFTYSALIEERLPGFRSTIQERPGWTTSAYLEKWDEIEREFPSRADLVFIQLGIEDLRINGHHESTITICIENINEIMKRVKHHFPKADIVLMSGTKIDCSVTDNSLEAADFGEWTNEYLSRIGEGYSMLAVENNYNFVDLHRLVPLKSTYDGVHLDKNGHNIVANVIIRFLSEYMVLDQAIENKNQP